MERHRRRSVSESRNASLQRSSYFQWRNAATSSPSFLLLCAKKRKSQPVSLDRGFRAFANLLFAFIVLSSPRREPRFIRSAYVLCGKALITLVIN